MRKRSVRVSLVTISVLAVVAVACTEDSGGGDATGTEGGGANAGGPIWVLLPDTASSDRWEGDDLPLFTEAFEAAGLANGEDFNIVNAEGDAATQQSQAEQAIADGASVIVLTSLDTGSGAAIIDQAKDAGVEVIEYDRFNTGGSGGVAYVSFDNVAVGAAMAEAMEPAIDDLGAQAPASSSCSTAARRTTTRSCSARATPRRSKRRSDAGDWELVADQLRPGLGQRRGPDDHGADPGRREQRGRRRVRRQRRARATRRSTPLEAAGHRARSRSAARTRPPPACRTSPSASRPVSVYKPIQDEAGVAAAIALALRDGEDYEAAATGYESTLASGGSQVAIIGINAEDGYPAESADGRRRRAVRRTGADRRDGRQHHGHRDRGRVPDSGRDLHGQGRRHRLLPGERGMTDG